MKHIDELRGNASLSCIEIFDMFDDIDIKEQLTPILDAWAAGRELSAYLAEARAAGIEATGDLKTTRLEIDENKEAINLLLEVMDYRHGAGEYDLSKMNDYDRENARHDKWNELEDRICLLLDNHKD